VNRRNVIILAIAVVAILGAALFFLNYSGKDDNAEVASQEAPVSAPAAPDSEAAPADVGDGEPG